MRLVSVHRLLGDLVERHRGERDVREGGVELGEVEEVVDQVAHRPGPSYDDLELGDLFGTHRRIVEQVLGVPLDDGQRRTQLVARERDEVVAAAVHLLEHRDLLALAVQHGLTLLGELVPLGDVGGHPVEEQAVALASRRTP